MFYNNQSKALPANNFHEYCKTIAKFEEGNTRKEKWLEKFRSLPLDERFFCAITMVFLDKSIIHITCLGEDIPMQYIGGSLTKTFLREDLRKTSLKDFCFILDWKSILQKIGMLSITEDDKIELSIAETKYLSLLYEGAYDQSHSFLRMPKGNCFYAPPFNVLVVEILHYFVHIRKMLLSKVSKFLDLDEQFCNFWVQRAIAKEKQWSDLGGGKDGSGVTVSGDPLEMDIGEDEGLARAAYVFNFVHKDFKQNGFDNFTLKDYLDTQNNYLKMKDGYRKLKLTKNPNEEADRILQGQNKDGSDKEMMVTYEDALNVLSKRLGKEGINSSDIRKMSGVDGMVRDDGSMGSVSNRNNVYGGNYEVVTDKRSIVDILKEKEELELLRKEKAEREAREEKEKREREEEEAANNNGGYLTMVEGSILPDSSCRVYVYDVEGKNIVKDTVKMQMSSLKRGWHLQKIRKEDGREVIWWKKNMEEKKE